MSDDAHNKRVLEVLSSLCITVTAPLDPQSCPFLPNPYKQSFLLLNHIKLLFFKPTNQPGSLPSQVVRGRNAGWSVVVWEVPSAFLQRSHFSIITGLGAVQELTTVRIWKAPVQCVILTFSRPLQFILWPVTLSPSMFLNHSHGAVMWLDKDHIHTTFTSVPRCRNGKQQRRLEWRLTWRVMVDYSIVEFIDPEPMVLLFL